MEKELQYSLKKLHSNQFEAAKADADRGNEIRGRISEKLFYFSGFFLTALLSARVFTEEKDVKILCLDSSYVLLAAVVLFVSSIVLGFAVLMYSQQHLINSADARFKYCQKILQYMETNRVDKVDVMPIELEQPKELEGMRGSKRATLYGNLQYLSAFAGLILSIVYILI